LGTLVLRYTHPAQPRPFRCPAGKLIAAAGALVCLALMLSMPQGSWLRLFLWLMLGLAVYFSYSWYSGRLLGQKGVGAAVAERE
jgi:APA family basic amino acid/polyamine antiporter